MQQLLPIVSQFDIEGTPVDITPLGNGLINDTYLVRTTACDYVLQRINHDIFRDVAMLQHNIEAVTAHIRKKLKSCGADDIDRRVLRLVATRSDKAKTWHFDGENYWRMSHYIPRTKTLVEVTSDTARSAGEAFGNFQYMLSDIDTTLGETIPDFHNMEFRLQQFREAVASDCVGRVSEMQSLIDAIEERAERMTLAERLYCEGQLPKRVCHCDTKVNNMLYDAETNEVLCVIDLDTVMPSFIFSDYGDFLRTGANRAAEDEPDLTKVSFRMDIFEAFTEGYLSSAGKMLTPIEIDNLPYAVVLFPYMQCVRFLTDYLNGDTYYKISYAEHNEVRARSQFRLVECIEELMPVIKQIVERLR